MPDELSIRSAGQLGLAIEQARARMGWTQVELAQRAGTSQRVVSQLEAGQHRVLVEILLALFRETDTTLVARLPGFAPRDPAKKKGTP